MTDDKDVSRAARKRMAQVGAFILLPVLALFLLSGNPRWLWGWRYLGLYLVVLVVNRLIVMQRDPELMAERGRIHADAKAWDKALAPLVSLLLPLITLVICALDERTGWSPRFAVGWHVLGLAAMALGYGLVTWAMASNRYFSGVVRIPVAFARPGERGHTVATAGPYAYVRHPGYSGMILFTLATPVLLGSLWGVLVAVVTAALFVLRTILEDSALSAELAGYESCAVRVRYRLLPAVW